MDFELVDYDEYLPRLKKYFSCYLRGRMEYQHLHPETKQPISNTQIHFYNLDVGHSIYFFNNEGFTYFGLGREIEDFASFNAIKLSTHLNYQIKVKEAIHFAKDELNKIFLIMPINCDLLSDKEIFSLKDKNEILVIDDVEYINFGELKRGIHILRNLRNFMEHITVDSQYTSFLKLVKVRILYKFSKDPNFCPSCDNLIAKSYENNEIIKNLVGDNPKICADCYSKKLMNYFLSKATNIFLNKYYLEILADNSLDIKFYLDLFEKYCMFDENGFLDNTSTKSSFVPPKFQLNTSFLETMQSYSDLINEKTMIYDGDELSDFESTLLKNNLSYAEGFEIKNQVEYKVLSGKLKLGGGKYINRIDVSIKNLINVKSNSKKNRTNIFKIIEILNRLTLNSKGELNEDFINHITAFGFDESVCWKIRDELIEGIENQTIKKNHFPEIFNKTCDAVIQEELDKLFTKKECYCFNDSIYLKIILNQKEMVDFVKNLNSINDALEINHFNLFNLNNNFFKIILDFNVIKVDVLSDFLDKFGFNKTVLYYDNGED
ncbi:hypothetical protein, partial [Methanobrevibacter woesei]|uniref:hypothetical protein n=1 Tax=Methanobrevibacter woesei TaxID=190976 RepID=UPI0026DFAB8C